MARPLLSGMPEPSTPMYQSHVCYTHLDPLADVLGVYGCACKSCRRARAEETEDHVARQDQHESLIEMERRTR